MKKLKNSELNRIDVTSFKSIKKTPLIVVLDNIRSLNNIGSIFRTCDAFLVSKIYLCGITAKPPNRKINKTALGSTESVEWEYFKSTKKIIEKLKSKGVKISSFSETPGVMRYVTPLFTIFLVNFGFSNCSHIATL